MRPAEGHGAAGRSHRRARPARRALEQRPDQPDHERRHPRRRAAEILADREQVRQMEEAERARRDEPEVRRAPAVEISGREVEM
ncbi:hypothetical protein DDW44_01415 [Streptomyces tirandamycinicus]|uniref:Uncharacterized protein n=1 Tax=Streptomyces tirandamycinicus TaxID=2174846 RepID=A0A2S1SMF4_9ACTN|nr:hypothetical protein DDW44_01415 [Streptomyces tirandamycinicus]